MKYYIFVENDTIQNCGNCPQINEEVMNIEVSKDVYDSYIEDSLRYIFSNGKIIKFDSRLVFEAVDSTDGDYVVSFQRPTAENNYTWYRKYKSGWVEQGGQFTATSVADGSGTAGNNIINLPIKMANDRYWYSANTHVGANGWNYANGVILNARATTTLTLKVVAGTGDLALYWEVKGMAA